MIRKLFTILDDDARALRRLVVGLVAGAALQGIGFALVVPIVTELIDGDTGAAARWVGAEVVVLLAFAVVHYRAQMAGYLTALALSRRLYRRLGDHISRLPLGWFDDTRAGSVARITSSGVVDVMGMPAHLLRPLVDCVVIPITTLVVVIVVDPIVGLVGLVAAPLAYLVYRWSAGLIERTEHQTDRAAVTVANRLVEFARAQPVLRASGTRDRGFGALDTELVAQRAVDRRMLWQGIFGLLGFATFVQATFAALLLATIATVLDGTIDPGQCIALLVLLTLAVEPLNQASELGGTMRIARNTIARMDDLWATPLLPEPAEPVTPDDVGIELRHVAFAYDATTPVLEDVSLTVAPGTMTALVGPSGSGKTTIARLVGRFWDVTDGTVLVGGVDVRRIRTEDLMARLSFVFQDVYLFAGTIEENIRIARPDATDAEVAEAIRLARVDEIADRLPDGLATQVGEAGTALSGGERQRVSIARALLKNAPIVLLDEITAALDAENEAYIQEALRALTRDRTILVIAHRLQTIAAADQIVVLADGRVAEQGTHGELLAHDGRYAAFWHQRVRANGWHLATTAEPASG